MLKDRKQIYKNVKGSRHQTGVIFGPNPRRATKWCDQPTGPTSGCHIANDDDWANGPPIRFYKSKWKLKLNLGFWGVANAIGNVRNNSQMGDANP